MTPEPEPVRVLFIGGKGVGCGILRVLVDAPSACVCGVVVNPNDTDSGQWYPSASEIARGAGIPVRAPGKVNLDEEIAWIRACDPDLIVVAYYDQILAREIFEMPRLGCVNLHFARAERYRGCYPTTWALINGDAVTGVTLHRVTGEIDGGEIVAEREVPIAPEDTGLSLYAKCTQAGIALFAEALPALLSGRLPGRPQLRTVATRYHDRAFPSHEIRFEGDARSVLNRIRALHFPPFPAPYFYLGGKKFLIIEESEQGE